MINSLLVGFCLLLVCFKSTLSAIADHEIKSLPGWDGDLPSKQYSGLLQLPHTNPARFYHYWLVTSENDPTNDPIVLWLNGGPGASSLLGYFTEQGPFHVNDDSIIENTTDVPVLFYNNYTWAKVVNIIFLESPAGVGFSYCNGSAGPIDSCPNWNDTNVAQDNHAFLQQFFKYYPEYMENDFYVTGESYAGIYVPTLVMQIEANSTSMPALTGFAVGDGCMGIDSRGGCGIDDTNTFVQFMYGHAQMSQNMYNNIYNICGNALYYGNTSKNPECKSVLQSADTALGGYNVYNIYDECYLENDEIYNEYISKPPIFRNKDGHIRFHLKSAFNGAMKRTYNIMNYPKLKEKLLLSNNGLSSGINQYACGGDTITSIYLSQASVKTAIHVTDIPWIWQDGDWTKYKSTQHDLRPYYQTWVSQGKYKILIYYGDVDSAVPYNGGEEWTSQLGFPVKVPWRPWTTDGGMLMGGYVQIYESTKNFTYLTVRGAGHEVPQYKPQEALKFFECWIKGEDYPPYTGSPGRH